MIDTNLSKLKRYAFPVLIFSFMFGFSSCNLKKPSNPDGVDLGIMDSTKLSINLPEVDSMKIIFTDNENDNKFVQEKDWAKLVELLQTASYDTAWNNKDIMIKMVAPDYTIVIAYENQDTDHDDWLMIWKETGKTKFKNTWFILEETEKNSVTGLLESYRK